MVQMTPGSLDIAALNTCHLPGIPCITHTQERGVLWGKAWPFLPSSLGQSPWNLHIYVCSGLIAATTLGITVWK